MSDPNQTKLFARFPFILAFVCILTVSGTGCGTATPRPDSDAQEVGRARMEAVGSAHKARGADEAVPGSDVTLSSPDDPALDGKYRVEFDGVLKLPYKVKVNVDGLNREKLARKLADAYSKFYKTPPTINVAINTEHYWVEVRGLVEKPGRFLIKSNTSLDEVIAMAGGTQKTMPVNYVRIQQGKKTFTLNLADYYAGSSHVSLPAWEGGDLIFLQSERGEASSAADLDSGYVQVVGEVHTPGEYRYVKGADFYHYLVKAGGPSAGSDLNNIELVRDSGKEKFFTRFAFNRPNDIPAIQPGDLIVVMAEKPSTFERTVPLVSGIVGILNTILLMTLVL